MKKIPLTLEEIAQLTACRLVGSPNYPISNVADLESATPEDASFLANPLYKQKMQRSKAGVIFIDENTSVVENKNFLISSNPSFAFQKLIDTLHPPRSSPSGFTNIHPSAIIHESAQIGEGVTIGPYAVIDENVRIGSHTFIGTAVYIGPEAIIGEECLIHPKVVIREQCTIGHRVTIQPGAVIGSCGFGYSTDQQGLHTKLNQVGNVYIEDDVEIGANTTIDRARFKSTVIGKGTKIDNLVQLGHNVKVGPHNLIVAQTGIAGSTTTGKSVILAGQVAVAGHVHLEDYVIITGKSGVSKSLPTGKYGGIPAFPLADYNRQSAYLRHIETYVKQIKQLEKQVQELKEQVEKQSHL